MFWCWAVILGGLLALVFFILSAAFAKKGKNTAGLVCAVLELLSAGHSVSVWMWALASSGKPTFLFGLAYFWPMSLICISMFAVGTICVIVNARGIAQARKSGVNAAQA